MQGQSEAERQRDEPGVEERVTAEPSVRRKRVHPSLPGRYRELKKRLRRVQLALAAFATLTALLSLALVAVSASSNGHRQQLELELAVLHADLDEAGRVTPCASARLPERARPEDSVRDSSRRALRQADACSSRGAPKR